ncbi:MAG TPA: VCBS repeat-containing protein [Solirubrobacteraceae bacterium]|nr:VCBS repeat-containing protein [Solirubrobacteraceae bacterium]
MVALVVVGTCMALGVGSSRAAQVSFSETSSIPLCDGTSECGMGTVDTNPTGGALAALTGHGSLDLVIAQPVGVAVMVNDGGGVFSDPQLVPGSPAPATDVAAGELQGQGLTDVVVGTASGITIMRSDGHGGLEPEQSIDLGGSATDINIVPLNGHGEPDIVALVQTASGGAYVVVLLNRGGGRFSAPLRINTGGNPSSLAVADMNHDRIPDLIVSEYPYISVLLGEGSGRFAQPRETALSPLGAGTEIYIGDLDGDGNLDALVGGYLYPGDGKGDLGSPVFVFNAGGGESVDALADFTGDGHLDIATYDSVILGNGDGTFQPPVPIPSPGTPPRVGPDQLIASDLNDDGRPDLIRLEQFHESGRPFVGNVDVLINTTP